MNPRQREIMTCKLKTFQDMNMGDEGSDGTHRGSSPYRSKYPVGSNRLRNGTNDPAAWRSYSESENQVCKNEQL